MAQAVAELDALRAELPGLLTTAVRHAMSIAMKHGMPADEAAEVTAIAAADLARAIHGDSYLLTLATKVIERAGQSLCGEEKP